MTSGHAPEKIQDSDWALFEEKHARHLTHLVENPQSPFYRFTKPSLSRILQRCNASITHIPKPQEDNKTEGYVLFRQLKPLRHAYLIATGAVIFYTLFRKNDITEAPEPELYERVEIDTLIQSYQYMGTIGPGQWAGLLEVYVKILSRNSDNSPRREAIKKAHLYELAGKWFLSGFVATDSWIIRIPLDELISLLEDTTLSEKNGKTEFSSLVEYKDAADPVNKREQIAFVRRCGEELSLRQSQWLTRTSLIERGFLDAIIAYDIYLYGQRRIASMDHRSHKLFDHLRSKKEKLIWYSGMSEQDFNRAFKRLLAVEPSLIRREYKTSDILEILDLEGLLTYYLKRLTEL